MYFPKKAVNDKKTRTANFTSSVLFRDKIFGTNQPVSTYSTNTGKFVSNVSDSNDYLVYE